MLKDIASPWIDDDQFTAFARGHQQLAIGAEGQGIGSQARQIDLESQGSDGLIDGGMNRIGSHDTDFFAGEKIGWGQGCGLSQSE